MSVEQEMEVRKRLCAAMEAAWNSLDAVVGDADGAKGRADAKALLMSAITYAAGHPVESTAHLERQVGYWRAFTTAVAVRGASLSVAPPATHPHPPHTPTLRSKRWECTLGTGSDAVTITQLSPEAALTDALMEAYMGNVPAIYGLPKPVPFRLVPSTGNAEEGMVLFTFTDPSEAVRAVGSIYLTANGARPALVVRVLMKKGEPSVLAYAEDIGTIEIHSTGLGERPDHKLLRWPTPAEEGPPAEVTAAAP